MTPYQRQMAAIQSGNVDSTVMLGIRKALNARRRGPSFRSVTAPKTTVAECDLLLAALALHKPLVRGELHASGVRTITAKRYAKRLATVQHKIDKLMGFRLVGYGWTPSGTSVAHYEAIGQAGAFTFRYVPWQAGGDGVELLGDEA